MVEQTGVRVREPEISRQVLERLRTSVRNGAGHECAEWILEGTRTCALCDCEFHGEPLRELNPMEAGQALGRAVSQALKKGGA